jgi:hypothetical protein
VVTTRVRVWQRVPVLLLAVVIENSRATHSRACGVLLLLLKILTQNSFAP